MIMLSLEENREMPSLLLFVAVLFANVLAFDENRLIPWVLSMTVLPTSVLLFEESRVMPMWLFVAVLFEI